MEIEDGKIYRITNNINKKVYIGMTIRPIGIRWSQHLYSSKNSECYLYRSMRKYGIDNFEIKTLLDEIKSFSKLKELEKQYIKKYNSFEDGYNLTLGGEGMLGYKHTEDHKKYISEVLTGLKRTPKQNERNRQAGLGVKQSKETIEKRMKYVRGVPKSESHRRKLAKILDENRFIAYGKEHPRSVAIAQIDIKTNEVIEFFDTIAEAEISLHLKQGNGSISRVINGKRNKAYGYKWERVENDKRNINS